MKAIMMVLALASTLLLGGCVSPYSPPPKPSIPVAEKPKPPVDPVQTKGTFRDCAECPEMIRVPAGDYMMGSPSKELEALKRMSLKEDSRVFKGYDLPVHQVVIEKPFAVGVKEVTRGEYKQFVRATGHKGSVCRTREKLRWGNDTDDNLGLLGASTWLFGGVFVAAALSSGDNTWEERERNWENPGFVAFEKLEHRDDHPVVCVNWNDAKAYVKWLSEKTGKEYRLLSEAEWEYAARAGTTTERYWGGLPRLMGGSGMPLEQSQCGYANGSDIAAGELYGWRIAACNDGHAHMAPVGSFSPNKFGLYDMMGNVMEWVEDCWNKSYAGAPSDGSAWESGNCKGRVLRGGSWGSDPEYMRSAFRFARTAAKGGRTIGFRVAQTLAPSALGGTPASGTVADTIDSLPEPPPSTPSECPNLAGKYQCDRPKVGKTYTREMGQTTDAGGMTIYWVSKNEGREKVTMIADGQTRSHRTNKIRSACADNALHTRFTGYDGHPQRYLDVTYSFREDKGINVDRVSGYGSKIRWKSRESCKRLNQ